jgi:DNA-binding NtrC family response regulator
MKTKSLPADVFFEAVHDSEIEPLRRKPVLVICDNEECGDTVAQIIRKRGIETVCCVRLSDARSFLLGQIFSAVFCSDSLPDGDFRTVIRAAGSTPVIVFSRLADWDGYLEAVHRGAFDYTACPPNSSEIERILQFATSEPRLGHQIR